MSDFIRDDDGVSNTSSNPHLHQLIEREIARTGAGLLLDTLVACGVDKEHRGREKASDHAPVWVEISA